VLSPTKEDEAAFSIGPLSPNPPVASSSVLSFCFLVAFSHAGVSLKKESFIASKNPFLFQKKDRLSVAGLPPFV